MDIKSDLQVVNVDRVDGGIYIEFDNGRCALYVAELLYSIIEQAVPLEKPRLNAGGAEVPE